MEDFEFDRPLGPHAPDDRILMEPIGVVGMITPWNWPMSQVALKVIPALLAGCTMVLKPSEFAPLSSALLAEIIDEAARRRASSTSSRATVRPRARALSRIRISR